MASVSGVHRRQCLQSPQKFCYICGSYVFVSKVRLIDSFLKKLYFSYFKLKVGDQDKSFAPHIACNTCVEGLRYWYNGKRKAMPFAIPMQWREQKNHYDDCYFCMVNVTGYNKKIKKGIKYPNLLSAIRPVPHGPDLPVPSPPDNLSDESESSSLQSATEEKYFEAHQYDRPIDKFTQSELNDLIRELQLTKEKSELLGSRLREMNMLASGVKFSWYRNREKEFRKYYAQEDQLVFCADIRNLLHQLGEGEYDPSTWRLFIDSSKRSLKAVLFHNSNVLASIPLAHSTKLPESYETLKLVLEKIKYHEHEWQICGDLKVIGLLLGLQRGYTKCPCFLFEWDSRARDKLWETVHWPEREQLQPGSENVSKVSLVDREKILLPPLHIKLGMMKQFVKALDRNSPCFQNLCTRFSSLSHAKIREGIFDGPQIRKLMMDDSFTETMTEIEEDAWNAFKEVVKKFLGNLKDPLYKEIVRNMLDKFKLLGCKMSLKLHFLASHLDYFPPNLGAVSEEQGERFHQDLKDVERRYQRRWDVNMMADYCWSIARDDAWREHSRTSQILRETEKGDRGILTYISKECIETLSSKM